MGKKFYPPDLIPNFCDYIRRREDVDVYLSNYLRGRKWWIQAGCNIPRTEIASRNRRSLKCLKEYLGKKGIRTSLYFPLHPSTGKLVITGFENFRRLSEKYGLQWWDEVKMLRKQVKLGKGELQSIFLNSLSQEWMSIPEIIRSAGWGYTPTNYGRMHVTAEHLIKKGMVEKKKERGKVYYRLISKNIIKIRDEG